MNHGSTILKQARKLSEDELIALVADLAQLVRERSVARQRAEDALHRELDRRVAQLNQHPNEVEDLDAVLDEIEGSWGGRKPAKKARA